MRTAIDTNVISTIVSNEPGWEVLAGILRGLRDEGALIVCAPVWAELGAHPLMVGKDVTAFLDKAGVTVDFALTKDIWAAAARAQAIHSTRRREQGAAETRRILADFLVGAHALLATERLITLDQRFSERTFPGLKLVPIPGTSQTASS